MAREVRGARAPAKPPAVRLSHCDAWLPEIQAATIYSVEKLFGWVEGGTGDPLMFFRGRYLQ